MSAADELGQRAEANLATMMANLDAIESDLTVIKTARWRLIRNRRLLDRSWERLRANSRLRAENDLLFMKRQFAIDQEATR